jgi:4-amino-4-deoxy-L-arabinose transferase-like glycosyltransferase
VQSLAKFIHVRQDLEDQWWQRVWPMALPLAFFVAMFLFFPFRERFEYDVDEGYVAMRSFLVARGYPLYTVVWSDQPPLFPYLMAVWIRLFGTDINAARTLVLLFSTILMAGAVYILFSKWGTLHALAGSILIAFLPYYTTLSVSVMVAVPNLAFAVLSLLALLTWHERRQTRWILASALALGLSVLTKLISVFLVPVFAIGILLETRARIGQPASFQRLMRPALLWCLVFAVVVGGVGLLSIGPTNLHHLFDTHLAISRNQSYIESTPAAQTIIQHLKASWAILFLAILGCIIILLERRWTSLYLLFWALSAFLVFTFYAPVWYHYQLLITVPAAMLGAIGVGEAIHFLQRGIHVHPFFTPRTWLSLIALAGFLLAIANRAPVTLPNFYHPPAFIAQTNRDAWPEQMFLTKMSNHAPQTHWVLTTLPMYAFRVGLPVPPFLAVSSGKRIAAGELSEMNVLEIFDQYKPEQVLIRRGEYPLLEERLEEGYRLLYSRGKRALYVRNDIKGQ